MAAGAHLALRALDRYVARRVEHSCTWWRTRGRAVPAPQADVLLELPCTPLEVTVLISCLSAGVPPCLGRQDVQMRMDVLRGGHVTGDGRAVAARQRYLVISPADDPMAVMAEVIRRGSAQRLDRLERLLGLAAVEDLLGEGWQSRDRKAYSPVRPSWAVGYPV